MTAFGNGTPRMAAVLAVLRRGGFWTTRQVAEELGLDVSLVSSVLGGLYSKRQAERQARGAGHGGPGDAFEWRAS